MPTITTKKQGKGKSKRSSAELPSGGDVSAKTTKKQNISVDQDAGTAEKSYFCMVKNGQRKIVMSEDKVDEYLMEDWDLDETYSNLREALAWKNGSNSAPAKTKEPAEASSEVNAAASALAVSEAAAEEHTSEEEGEEQGGGEELCGSLNETETHQAYCSRDGLWYKTLEEVGQVKVRLDSRHLQKLGHNGHRSSLGVWVMTQRTDCNAWKEGKKSSIDTNKKARALR